MGTRSNTLFVDHGWGKESVVLNLFRHYDSYPSYFGKMIHDFLSSRKLVNGFTTENRNHDGLANGVGCLAAQFVAVVKEKPGNVSLCPVPQSLWEGMIAAEDYTYVIHGNTQYPDDDIVIEVYSWSKKIFEGPIRSFGDWCSRDKEES